MGLLRIMLPPKLQLLAVLVFGVAVLFLENQIQKLEESRGKLGEQRRARPGAGPGRGRAGGSRGPAGGSARRRVPLAGPGDAHRWDFSRGAPCVYMPETVQEPVDAARGSAEGAAGGSGCSLGL